MKSKVILFCVWLFCSQIVEAIPFSKDIDRNLNHQPAHWAKNGNAPRPNTGFPQTQHGNENNPKYYANEGALRGFDNYRNNNDPIPLVGQGYYTGKNHHLQDKSSDQQYQNSQSQNQYGFNRDVITAPLAAPSTRGSSQYPLTQHNIPSTGGQYYQKDRAPLRGQSYPYPLFDSNSMKYNSYTEPSGDISRLSRGNNYDGLNRDPTNKRYPLSDTSVRNFDNLRDENNYESNSGPHNPVNNFNVDSISNTRAKHSGNSYTNDAPSTVYKDQKYLKYRSDPGISDITLPITAGITDDLSDTLEKNDYVNSHKPDPGFSNFPPDFENSDITRRAIVPEDLPEKYGKKEYSDFDGSDSRSNKPHANPDNLPIKSDFDSSRNTYKTKSHRAEGNDRYDYRPSNPVPVNTNNGAPAAPTIARNPEKSKYVDNFGPRHGPSKVTLSDQSEPVLYHNFRIGTEKIDVKKLASHPAIRKRLQSNTNGFIIFNPDGTIKFVEVVDPSVLNNPNYLVLRTTGNHHVGLNHPTSDGAYTTQPSPYVPSNIGTKSVPINEQTVPLNGILPANNNDQTSEEDSSQYDYNLSSTTVPSINIGDSTVPTQFNSNRPDNIKYPLVSNENDYNPLPTTLPSIEIDYFTSPTQLPTTTEIISIINNTANENQTPRPIVSSDSSTITTTPLCRDDTCKDSIITISPIELTTSNVSDVPLVTSTTANPIKELNISDTTTYINNKQNGEQDNTGSTDTSILDKDHKYTTTTVTAPITPVLPIDGECSDEILTNGNNIQSNYNTVANQGNNPKNESQIATYNSLSNTDVPAKYDDYSPTTAGPSVQSNVYTGDTTSTPGDNPLQSNQPTNDLIITLNTTYDSEDDTITITIEVSESTDDADTSKDEKTIDISIDTQDSSDHHSKSSNKGDGNCNKDQSTDDTNKGKNIEIDVINLKGEPTVWFKTTDQNLIDKLMANDDTNVVYLISRAPTYRVETEKIITKHCNGTDFIEITKSTWKNENDLFPKIEKNFEVVNPT